MMDIAKQTGLTREHLYTGLSENGNPTLQTLTVIMNTLGYQLTITPIHRDNMSEDSFWLLRQHFRDNILLTKSRITCENWRM